jgi:hypothetical protein
MEPISGLLIRAYSGEWVSRGADLDMVTLCFQDSAWNQAMIKLTYALVPLARGRRTKPMQYCENCMERKF